jgi:hypothetical protein
MKLVKTKNGAVVQYPYTLDGLKLEHPNVSFPVAEELTASDLAGFGVFFVQDTPVPTFDFLTQTYVEHNPVALDGQWVRVFEVVELSDDGKKLARQQVTAHLVDGVQRRLDDFAKTRDYEGVLSACTYANSSVPKFQLEGQYCVSARDASWAKLYEILAEVDAGLRPMPHTFAEIEGELPALEWPAS